MTGKHLSHYLIESELGRGGMGIVYKAEDTKLDRTVAIKVLPSATLASEEDRSRFYREAKAAAALHHPNIASVFEIDEAVPSDAPHDAQPSPFIAMEFIDGQTLDDYIKEAPLKLDEAVNIASQIASGLEAAHEKNIVHRDIKAANVMLTSKGVPKILDFGLAQTSQSTKLTRMGSTMGTVAYMSPEQARGEEVDLRSDLWSLGAVIYEMVAGRSPFAGDYEQAVIYEILNQDPEPLTAVRTGVSMELERIVSKSLNKDRELRYQHAADLIADLKSVEPEISNPSIKMKAVAAKRRDTLGTSQQKKFLVPVLAVLLLVLGWGAGRVWDSEDGSTGITHPVRFVISTPGGYEAPSDSDPALHISPDGKAMVYRENGVLRLRRLDEEHSQPIPGTEGATTPMFSPNGDWIAFLQDGLMKKVNLNRAGATTPVSDVPISLLQGGDWGESDQILLGLADEGIWSMDVRTGAVDLIAPPIDSDGEWGLAWPQEVRSGSDILFSAIGPSGKWHDSKIVQLDLETGIRYDVVTGGTHGRYVSTGHVLYADEDGVLQAIPYDLDTHEAGTPVPVEEGLIISIWGAGASFAVSRNGTLIFARGNSFALYDIDWYDRLGTRVETVAAGISSSWGLDVDFRGERVVTTLNKNRNDDIYIFDSGSMNPIRFTSHASSEGWPAWSPDGTQIAWERDTVTGGAIVLIKNVDGITGDRELIRSSRLIQPSSWSPDGKWLLLEEYSEQGSRNIIAVNVDDSTNVITIAASPSPERHSQFSPDGAFVTYDSIESGEDHTYVTTFPVPGVPIRISESQTIDPRWSPAGNELFFWQDKTLMVARYSQEPRFVVQKIDSLFSLPNLSSETQKYDVGPDGHSFLIRTDNPDAVITEIQVVLNYFEILKAVQ